MTYPQPPYQLPQGPLGYAYPPSGFPDPLAPARRASVMLFILAAIGGLCGLFSSLVWVVPLDQMLDQMKARISQQQLNQLPAGMDLVTFVRALFTAMAVIGLLLSIGMLVSGIFVRRGSRGATVVALVICILLALISLVGMIGGVFQLASGDPSAAVGALFWVLIAVLVGLTIVWLIQALRSTGQFHQQQQQMMHHWYQQQHQAAQAQPGYGYNPPPPPQQPPSPPGSQS